MTESKTVFSRRAFLQGTALAATGALAIGAQKSAPTGPAAAAAHRGPVRLGVAGGNFGAQMYWHEHPDCKVVAVADLIPERVDYLKEVYHCTQGYGSLEEMLEKAELDAVAVFTDGNVSADHCVLCLEKGLHVVTGSPAAMTLDQAAALRRAVLASERTYMMAETSYYHQSVISARQWFQSGDFGCVFSCEAEYHHPGLEKLFVDSNGQRTWRYGLAPMLYSTHCTAPWIGVTADRLTEVTCHGWGDDSPILQDNAFKNPFWGATALYKSAEGNTLRAAVYFRGALAITERAQWLGQHVSFYSAHPNGSGPIIRRTEEAIKRAAAAGQRVPRYEKYDQPMWWETDLLPEPLRHISGHDGSHTFLTHEFIDALTAGRLPAMDIDTALNMTLPGIIAHQSALQGGKTLTIPAAAEL